MADEFDVIVVGSGMSGGYAAKELCERGLKVLVIERGRHVEHRGPEYTDMLEPWQRKNFELMSEELMDDPNWAEVRYAVKTDNPKWFVRFEDAPYTVEEGTEMSWVRAFNTGGRSVLWSRQTYRMGPVDFEANAKDGNGVPWPISYDDLKPWYDRVDRFVGIAGENAGVENVPDGIFQPSFGLTAVEKILKEKLEANFPGRRMINGRCAHLTKPTPEQEELGRVVCQTRSLCNRGCSFGAYYSSLSASLPAAERTGNMTIVNDTIVTELVYDESSEKVTGVRTIDANTKEGKTYNARVVFLCASAFGSVQLLLQSKSDAMPNGLGNTYDVVGRYITDHVVAGGARGKMPGFEDRYYEGRRPTGFYIPRFRNIVEPGEGYLRGGAYQSGSSRAGPERLASVPGFGADNKHSARQPAPWEIRLSGFGEMLPRASNRVTLNPTEKDKWGLPLLHFNVSISENEHNMSKQLRSDAAEMLRAAGAVDIEEFGRVQSPGARIHEMGGAVMGDDPTKSVTNKYNQLHVAKNVFITDGSCFPSGGCQNPSISYMAMTARAANNCADMLAEGALT